MGQIKIYGLRDNLRKNKKLISKAIHLALVKALKYPEDKKFHRFISLDKEDFIFPDDRSENYLIVEIIMFTGRTIEAKRKLINLIFKNITDLVKISMNDIEITIIESPPCNWGIRGKNAEDLILNYKVNV